MLFRFSLLVALVFSGAIFGFFYAWVCSTMWGLDQLSAQTAIEAMNAMNRSVRNAVFAPAFFGTPVVIGLVAIWGWRMKQQQVAFVLGAAAVLYIAGAFVPTAIVNVPMNLALMETDLTQAGELDQIWGDYSARWQVWNIARTIVSGVVLVLVGYALLLAGPSVDRQRSAG